MTDDNSNLVDMDDLDEFENTFYAEPEEEQNEVVEEVEDTDDDAVATDEDTDAAEEVDDEEESEEDSDEDEDSDEEEEEEEKPQQKKGRNRKSFQERIDELTRRAYEAERREIEALRRLEEREARERKASKEEPIQDRLPPGAPDPHAKDENDEPLYPLGEFDPAFIRDITKFTIQTELAEKQRIQQEQAQARELEAAKEELRTQWQEKLEKAEEENPDIREDITDLVETFQDLDPAYGEYLAMTIMQCENGPNILEYLSQNIGEAQKIVASGPAAATLSIGKLEARLARKTAREEKRNAKMVSHAPEPPTQVTKGRKGQRVVRPDTDDLDAFERIYYKK